MDTSETFIKMCEKAWEIQALRQWKVCDYYFHPKDGNIITMGEECRDYAVVIDVISGKRFALDDPIIWLPRQDQLQEMVPTKLGSTKPNFKMISELNHFFGYWDTNGIPDFLSTWEQLWLAFVMSEKYSKVWDGSDWLNVNK